MMRGLEAIRHLQERTCALRCQDLAGFRRWLRQRLESWERDPVFRQRARIRDLRRQHPELLALEAAVREARRALQESADHPRVARLERDLHKATRAVQGLTEALPEHPHVEEKLAFFRERRERLTGDLREARGPLPALELQLHDLNRRLGVAEEEAILAELLRTVGRLPGRKGRLFEEDALALSKRVLVPELQAEAVLTGVTMGAADTEFDQLLVRGANPVQVVAVVEAKRNPNDLARGWRKRHESLAWLQGKLVDPERFRTDSHPTGRFQSYTHQGYLLTSESFAGVEELHLISRPGPLWGADGRALARMAFRLSTDLRLKVNEKFRQWCLGLLHAWETPELLEHYAGDPARAVKLLLCDDFLQEPPQDRSGHL
jgi:hypothetical protein